MPIAALAEESPGRIAKRKAAQAMKEAAEMLTPKSKARLRQQADELLA